MAASDLFDPQCAAGLVVDRIHFTNSRSCLGRIGQSGQRRQFSQVYRPAVEQQYCFGSLAADAGVFIFRLRCDWGRRIAGGSV